jgi:hypothetical protein
VLFCAASAFLGATTPLFFELGAEVTYPSNVGVSGGLISGMLNFVRAVHQQQPQQKQQNRA